MTPKMESVSSLSFFATFSSLTKIDRDLSFIIYYITEKPKRGIERPPRGRGGRSENFSPLVVIGVKGGGRGFPYWNI